MAEPIKQVMSYIFVKDCGCCDAIMVDRPEHVDDVKSFLLEGIKGGYLEEGYHIERVTVEEARTMFGQCSRHKAMAEIQPSLLEENHGG